MKGIRISIAVLSLLMVACRPDKPVVPEDAIVGKGVFVLNEGSYTFANSSLTFYDPEADTVTNNLFYRVNGSPIGDVGQSLFMMNDKLYIVVNNSNYIYRVDGKTMKYESKIEDFYSPRQMMAVSPTKAYVTDLMGSGLWIINPQDMSHCGAVEMGKPTENMALVGNELYVTNWSNYYNPDVENNTVQVVDCANDVKVAEIVVGREPNSIVVDAVNHVWVLCSGGYEKGENPCLVCIDPIMKKVVRQLEFAEGYPKCYPTNLAIDDTGRKLYFINNGAVYAMSVDAMALPDEKFVETPEGSLFYNVKVSPVDGDVYVTDAKNYMTNGMVYRYTSDGVGKGSFVAGIIPGAMLFN